MSLKRIRATYYLLHGLFWFSTSLLAPLYILFLMQKGLDLGQIGLWAGANTLAVIILELPTGGLADAWGRGRTFATANVIIAVSLLLMVLVPGKGILFVGAAVFGAGRALSSGSLDAWFIDALKIINPNVDIERELGPAGAVALTALAIGSLIGSVLPGLPFSVSLLPGLPPLALPLLLDALLKIFTSVLTMLLIREPSRHETAFHALRVSLSEIPMMLSSIKSVLGRNRSLLWLFAGSAFIALGFGSLENLWQPRFALISGQDSGIMFGVVMASCFFAGALCSILAPLVTRLFSGRRYYTAFLFSIFTSGALFLLSFSAKSGLMAVSLMLAYFAGEGVSVPRKAMLNDGVPSAMRATMLSVDSLASYIGFAGITALGFLAASRGIPIAWRLVAIVLLPASGVYIAYGRKEHK